MQTWSSHPLPGTTVMLCSQMYVFSIESGEMYVGPIVAGEMFVFSIESGEMYVGPIVAGEMYGRPL